MNNCDEIIKNFKEAALKIKPCPFSKSKHELRIYILNEKIKEQWKKGLFRK